MDVQEFYEILKQTDIGQNFSLEDANQLLKAGNFVDFQENGILMYQGRENQSILILLHGNAEILTESENGLSTSVCDVGRGAVLGEWGVIMKTACSCTIRTKTAIAAFSVSQGAFEELMLNGGSLGGKLCLYIARSFGNRTGSSQRELKQLRSTLRAKTEQLKQNNLKVKKQLFYLNSEIKKAKNARKGAQFVVSIGAGGLMALMGTFLWGAYYRATPELSYNLSHPTMIPYIDDPETCDKRSGSHWIGEQCWDYEHSREF
ncbi:MAG: cyclic nucleotide-binding domain-containing protein [Cyanobacteria bacterium P01_E01_bin.42]